MRDVLELKEDGYLTWEIGPREGNITGPDDRRTRRSAVMISSPLPPDRVIRFFCQGFIHGSVALGPEGLDIRFFVDQVRQVLLISD